MASHQANSSTAQSPYQRIAKALTRRPNRKVSNRPVPILSISMNEDDGGVDREGVFKSPLFHYASKTQLPLSHSLSRPSKKKKPDLGIRGRSATIGASSTTLLNRRQSEILRKEEIVPPSNTPTLFSRELSDRRRALSQPTTTSPKSTPQHKNSITSTPRGVPKTDFKSSNVIIDMKCGTSSPIQSQGYPGRIRNTVSPPNTMSPLYGVTFPNTPLGRAEPRNAMHISSDRANAMMSKGKTIDPTEITPLFNRLPPDNKDIQTGKDDLTAIKQPMERAYLQDQFEQLRMQPTRHISGEEDEEDEPTTDRGDASESAETLLSLIRQSRGSDQSVSTVSYSTGLPRTVSQTLSDSLRENNESQESAAYSIPSTLGSFSLHTLSRPLPFSIPSKRGSDQDRAQLVHLNHFKTAIAQYNAGSTSQSTSDSVPFQSISRAFPSTAKGSEVNHLEDIDIEIVEEQPIHQEHTTLIGVRRRLVEGFEDLGRRSGRILTSKASINMSQAAESCSSSSSPLSECPQRRWDFASDREMRKKEDVFENREKELTIEALSKAEMAHVKIEIWTESRKGKWIIRGSAENDGYPPEELPRITDPWAIPIDSKGIVRRKKLKSNVELSSTRTIVDCPHCAEGRQMGLQVQCGTCDNSTRVEMVYSIQCFVRHAQFLPLKLPAVLLLGVKQPHIKYIETNDIGQIIDILRDRAVNGLQSAAERVVKAHYAQHGSRLLMGRATIIRRGMLSVSVTSSKTKTRRNFDVEDGTDGKIIEVRPSTTRSQSTPARTAINIVRKQSNSPFNSFTESHNSSSTSLGSPPPFSNLLRKKAKEDNSTSSTITPLIANSYAIPLSPLGKTPSELKPKRSFRDMFYR